MEGKRVEDIGKIIVRKMNYEILGGREEREAKKDP